MSKFDEKLAIYTATLEKMGEKVDADMLKNVTKGLGPSIYKADAERVSCSDKTEKDRVKEKFLIGKLGLTDSADLDKAVSEVCDKFGSSNRDKFRPVFYYLLAKKFGKNI